MTGRAPAAALRMPLSLFERLADLTGTPLPWAGEGRGPRPAVGCVRSAGLPRLLTGALETFADPQVLVTVDLVHPGGRLRSWQRRRGGAVAAVTTAGGDRVELAWLPARSWGHYLTRTATTPTDPAAVARAVVAARVGGRHRVGWVESDRPALFAARVVRLAAGAGS